MNELSKAGTEQGKAPNGWEKIEGFDRISLFLIKDNTTEHGVWMALTTGPDKAEQELIFGTNFLPTAFTGETPAKDVCAAVQELNPSAIVRAYTLTQLKS